MQDCGLWMFWCGELPGTNLRDVISRFWVCVVMQAGTAAGKIRARP